MSKIDDKSSVRSIRQYFLFYFVMTYGSCDDLIDGFQSLTNQTLKTFKKVKLPSSIYSTN